MQLWCTILHNFSWTIIKVALFPSVNNGILLTFFFFVWKVQRHRISSGHSTPPSNRRILNFKRSLNTNSEDSLTNRSTTQHLAKDYVESLHQNSRATLLFGKNNVMVLPVNADVSEPMPGYLSLHQTANGLTIKWTPNQLMNGFADEAQDKR